jgi:hypothetical protein
MKTLFSLGYILTFLLSWSAAKADSATGTLTVSVTVIGPPPAPRVTEVRTHMTTEGIVTLTGTIPVTVLNIDY